MGSVKQKYVSLSIVDKLKAIRRVEDGEKMKAVADSFKIKPNTLSTIMKQKDVLRAKLNENTASKKFKRLRTGKNEALDKAVATFISQARAQHIPVSGYLIQSKARQLGSLLNVGKFTASAGWLQRFKRRFGLKYKSLSGDAAEADKSVAIDWIENVFMPLMSRYAEKDVFNADETGVFFKCLPNKTFAFKNDECKNGKHNKVRVTIMFCANMDGSEKIKPMVSKIWDNNVTKSRKAGFVDSNFDAEDELPVISYQEAALRNYEKLKAFLPEQICDKFDEYIDIDQEAMVGDVMTDEDIVESVQSNRERETPDENDEINDEDEPEYTAIKTVTKMEALGAIKTLQLALEQKENVQLNFFKALNEMSEFLNKASAV